MKAYKGYTLKEYLNSLSAKSPVPGGGSAAALTAALGVALISMVANYSKGKSACNRTEARIKGTLQKSERIRKRLLELVDLDAKAYLKVVAARKSSVKAKKSALKKAAAVPREVCRLCYDAIQLTPFLVQKGNKNLISDIEVASELLLAAFNSAKINIEINK